MAAMSGIIGGEAVLLGLIALPQMLRLGYDRNLAVGTICASGSLGTMIPPSIVLIICGLITETSIKALFTASFLPGFASFFIIITRTRLNPSLAPCTAAAGGAGRSRKKRPVRGVSEHNRRRLLRCAVPQGAVLQSDWPERGAGGRRPDHPRHAGPRGGLRHCLGGRRIGRSWAMGKGLVGPMVVIGVVLGSICGGITGITEAAGMGVIAVAVIATLRGEVSLSLLSEALKSTIKSTGTII